MARAVSPDGTEVARMTLARTPFRRRGLGVDIYVSAPDGTGARNVTQFDSETAYGAAWSPGGRTLVVISSAPRLAGSASTQAALSGSSTGPARPDVVAFRPILGAQARDWTTGIRWAPDGSWFAFESAPSSAPGPIDVVLVPLPGGSTVVVHLGLPNRMVSDDRFLAVIGGSSVGRRSRSSTRTVRAATRSPRRRMLTR